MVESKLLPVSEFLNGWHPANILKSKIWLRLAASVQKGIVNLKIIPLIPLLQVGVALSCMPLMVAISVDFHLS